MPTATDVDCYKILGVPETASAEQIKAAYRHLVRLWHPDLHDGDPHANDVLKVINSAYEVLSDPMRRAAYDRQRSERADSDDGSSRDQGGPDGAEQRRESSASTSPTGSADPFEWRDPDRGHSGPAVDRRDWRSAMGPGARRSFRIALILAVAVALLIAGVQMVQLLAAILVQGLVALLVPLTPLIAVWMLISRTRRRAIGG